MERLASPCVDYVTPHLNLYFQVQPELLVVLLEQVRGAGYGGPDATS